MKKFLAYFTVAVLGGTSSVLISKLVETPVSYSNSLQNYAAPGKMVSMPLATPENAIDFTTAASVSINAVVHVKTTYQQENTNNMYYFDPFGDWMWGGQPKPSSPQQSSGSGVIISNDGYIVTNNHVISKAEDIEVVLNDKRTYKAKVIGRDPSTDLALLKIDERNLPHLTYGNSDEIKIGEWVLAVGNPFNLNSTVTAGIVSAKARNINIIQGDKAQGAPAVESFIQTDAAVNPGNSGGALVNTNGSLVGINSAIASNTGSYTGYSFAIPVNIVRKVVADLLEFGEVQRGYIGVSIRDIDAKMAQEKNISVLKGVYVDGLTEGGAAKDAGIEEGDIITKIGDVEVNNVPQLQEQVSRFRPGDKIMVSLKRGEKEKVMPVVLKNKNGNVEVVKKSESENINSLGASFEPITKDEMQRLNINGGLKISKLNGGKLRGIGIREGFIITSIDKKKVNSLDDLNAAIENKKGGILIEGVYPNGMKAYYGFGL